MNIRLAALAAALTAMSLATGQAQQTWHDARTDHFRRGSEMFADKRYGAAETELNEALQSTMDAAYVEEARYMIACSRYRLGENNLDEIDRFTADYPGNSHKDLLSFMAGVICFRQGNYGEAVRRLGKCDIFALQTDDCEQALYALAVSCHKTGRLEEAKINYATLQEVSTRYGEDATYNLGHILYGQGDYDAALDEFGRLRHSDRFSTGAMTYMADIYLKTKDYDKAVTTADHLLDNGVTAADRTALLKIKGAALYGQGRMMEASTVLEDYRSSAAPSERDREALYMLGMACYDTQAYMKAADFLAEATAKDDALSQNAWLHIGLARLQLADNDRARLAFERASAMDFDRDVMAQALYNYGVCINETAYSPFNESVKVFERLINDYPGNRFSQLATDRLADAYLATSDYAAALESLDKINNPDRRLLATRQTLLFRLGIQHFANGDYALANDALTSSLAMGSLDKKTRTEAYFWRGETRYRLGDMSGADNDFRLYTEYENDRTNPTYALAYYNLGYVNFKKESYARALANFKKSKTLATRLPKDIRSDLANRMGDCYYRQRDFANAEACYAEAASLDPSQGDYAMYQRAFILGLQKDYDGKARLLDKLLADYQDSPLRDDAMYEKGRAYVMLDKTAEAISTYEALATAYPSSPYTIRAEAERAMLLHRAGDYDKAAEAYKSVIAKYPGTDEAGQAARDLKSLYVETNKVDDYFAFANTVGLDDGKGSGERDSLTYLAAERLYMSDNKDEGAAALEKYLDEYPGGAFAANADYYAGLYYYDRQDYPKATAHLDRFMDDAAGRFKEDGLEMLAGICYAQNDYAKAEEAYRKLRESASDEDKTIIADAGIMRCCMSEGKYQQAEEAATTLLAHAKADPQLIIEAHSTRAKALTALSQPQKALEDWRAISNNTNNEAGAEARFRIAEILFAAGDNTAAENEILEFIQTGTPHAYWMARSFILLADIYTDEGRPGDARQYLISLQQNYQGEKEIAEMIEERLEKLKDN